MELEYLVKEADRHAAEGIPYPEFNLFWNQFSHSAQHDLQKYMSANAPVGYTNHLKIIFKTMNMLEKLKANDSIDLEF